MTALVSMKSNDMDAGNQDLACGIEGLSVTNGCCWTSSGATRPSSCGRTNWKRHGISSRRSCSTGASSRLSRSRTVPGRGDRAPPIPCCGTRAGNGERRREQVAGRVNCGDYLEDVPASSLWQISVASASLRENLVRGMDENPRCRFGLVKTSPLGAAGWSKSPSGNVGQVGAGVSIVSPTIFAPGLARCPCLFAESSCHHAFVRSSWPV